MLRLGWSPSLDEPGAIELALSALVTAADEDSATGGPDLLRGIYPVVATIGAAGFVRIEDQVLRQGVEGLRARFSVQHELEEPGT